MKKRTLLSLSLLIAVVTIFTSCDNTTPTPVGPTLSTASLSADSVYTDSSFTISVTASKGDVDLTRIEVQENGTAIAASRLQIDGFTAGSNPSPLSTDAASSFTYTLTIVAGSVDGETSEYTVIVTDADGLTASESFDIYTEDFGTLVTERTMILLLNQAGPAGQGGLDLETGASTGTTAAFPDADLRDMGIDTNLPNASNWLQQIASINGAELKVPAAGLVYGEVLTKEAVLAAFEAGQIITTSDKVAVGDLFLVKTKVGNYFLLNTVAITPTAADNADKYEFSVKN
ncbi:MAG: hypothetical protein NWR72_09570 [Bacteroidia bacterium]|nr:hypothetical protein [Bacteroidia bacterium]